MMNQADAGEQVTDVSSSVVSVVLLDAQQLFTLGLESLLRGVEGISVVGNITSPDCLADCIELVQVDVVLMDVTFSGFDPFRVLADWTKEYVDLRFLVLSGYSEKIYAERLIRAGASGYISKNTDLDNLVESIKQVAEGELAVSPRTARKLLNAYRGRVTSKGYVGGVEALTDRELQVLGLIAQGMSTTQIASDMGIGKKTVDTFKERIKSKLLLQTSLQLAQYAGRALGISG